MGQSVSTISVCVEAGGRRLIIDGPVLLLREFLEAIQPKPDALPALQRAAEGTTHDGH